jgi:hypothetical protein
LDAAVVANAASVKAVNAVSGLHTEKVTGSIEDLFVDFERPAIARKSLDAGSRHRANELRNVRETGFRRGGPTDGDRFGR